MSIAQDAGTVSLLSPAPVADVSADITLRTEGPQPSPLRVGVPCRWQIIVRWENSTEDITPQIQKAPTFDNLRNNGSSTRFQTGNEDGSIFKEITYTYELIPERTGNAIIGAAAISCILNGETTTLITDRVEMEVLPAPFSLRRWTAGLWASYVVRFLLILLILSVLAAVTFLSLKRRTNVHQTGESAPAADPVEEALDSARHSRIEGNRQNYVQMLEQAVLASWNRNHPDREYKTLSAYRDQLDASLHVVFDRFVQTAEHVKYAPLASSAEVMEQLWNDAHRLMSR